MTGIVLIAIGSPFYKELSYNMALSLRQAGATEITLITDDGGAYYSMNQRKVFNEFLTADEDHSTDDFMMSPFKLKTFINHYTPYKKTLYLDSDGLWIGGSVAELFKGLTGFQMHEVARYNKANCHLSQMIWLRKKGDPTSNIEKAYEVYEIPDEAIYTETNSSFVYWEKTEENDKFFSELQHNYLDRRMPYTKVGAFYPDELAWNVTLARLNRTCEISLFRPFYFDYENKGLPIEEIKNRFLLIGLAGGYIDRRVISYYTNLVNNMRLEFGDGNKFKFNMLEKAYHEK